MTELPSFFVIAVILIHIAVSILVLYCVCRRHTCCRSRRNFTTNQDIGMTVVNQPEPEVDTPEGNDPTIMYRLSGISGVSSRNSGCFNNNNNNNSNSDTVENDPGMGHIYRFLGRSVSEEGSVYDSDTDVGVRHIRQALGIAADEQADPGVVHVRRALGLRAVDARSARGSVSDTALSQATTNVCNADDQMRVRSNTENGGHSIIGRVAQLNEGTSVRGPSHQHGLLIENPIPEDDPPTYQEALAILAREDEDFPPSYDDAVSSPT